MKLRLFVALVAALGVGAVMAQDTTSEKGKLSYAYGSRIGTELADAKLDVDLNTVIRGIQDGNAKRNPAVPMEQMQESLRVMGGKLQAEARAEVEKPEAAKKADSEQALAAHTSKARRVPVPDGGQ